MGALDSAVRQGKALYVGISSYAPDATREAAAVLAGLGTPLLIHQPSYSMLNRWIEDGLLEVLGELGVGCIGFSPLAQGLLTDRYAEGIPGDSRIARHLSLPAEQLNEQTKAKVAGLRDIAAGRGQTLAAMALAWTLRDPRMTSTLVGASSVEQLEANVHALERLDFTADELAEIDRYDGQRHQHLGDRGRGVGAKPLDEAVPRLNAGHCRPPGRCIRRQPDTCSSVHFSGRPRSTSSRRFGSAKRACNAARVSGRIGA